MVVILNLVFWLILKSNQMIYGHFSAIFKPLKVIIVFLHNITFT